MNLATALSYIRNMRDRDGLQKIINAAEVRATSLSKIDSMRERARLWKKIENLGLKKGDMVFIHVDPNDIATRTHAELWARPLTVIKVQPRLKEIVVRAAGSKVDHCLSPGTCIRMKLSKNVSPEALAAGLIGKTK